jgi:enamine deaminase RidA (YjgF/YER057c/UK114 family)
VLIEKKIEEMGVQLPEVTANTRLPLIPGVKVDNLLYCSGCGPDGDPENTWTGKVGREYSTEEGYAAARLCAIGLLAQAKAVLGDLDRIKRVVKVLGMVNCTPDFEDQPQVINGASDFFVEVFGEGGRHARSAVGMSSLPSGIPVEVEVIFEVD